MVIVQVTGEPYTYPWSNLSSNDSIYDLYAGTYTLEVTDSLGCVIVFDFPLIEPAEPLTSSITQTTDYMKQVVGCHSLMMLLYKLLLVVEFQTMTTTGTE